MSFMNAMSGIVTAFTVFAGIFVLFGPFVVHIWVTVATNWAALLLLGLVVPPIGWVHGVGVLLGIWAWS